jgi:ABC-type Zn2+ transport system substrate-binding protein/surface adhesin
MSLLEKIKSMFSGGSSVDADAHAGHDHSGDDHSHDDEHGHDHSHDPVPAASPLADDESTPE